MPTVQIKFCKIREAYEIRLKRMLTQAQALKIIALGYTILVLKITRTAFVFFWLPRAAGKRLADNVIPSHRRRARGGVGGRTHVPWVWVTRAARAVTAGR